MGRGEAPQGEELRSDAALSPGRHSPGELRVPRLPGSGTFQGVPPALAEARPSHPQEGWVRAETRLKLPTRGAEARGQGSRRRRARGVRVRVALGTWPLGPGPAIRGVTHRRWIPAAPRGPKPARRILRRGPVPAHPVLAPLVFFEGRERAGPHASDPKKGRENDKPCPVGPSRRPTDAYFGYGSPKARRRKRPPWRKASASMP